MNGTNVSVSTEKKVFSFQSRLHLLFDFFSVRKIDSTNSDAAEKIGVDLWYYTADMRA